jgi:3-hydroxymyristoyl/3-hydroxydecanoyl-(acyl carrier protein) dehydratase
MNDAGQGITPVVNTMRVSVPHDHACFPGHFPGQPILPGVLLLQRVMSLAQTSLAQALDVCTIYNVKFLAAVSPGDQLELRLVSAHCLEHKFTVHVVQAEGAADGPAVLACSGQLRIAKP